MKEAILIVSCVVLSGCNRTPPELIGTWIGRYEVGPQAGTAHANTSGRDVEWKHIYSADGKFLSVFKDEETASGVESHGTWKLIDIDGNEVTFETTLAPNDKPAEQVSKITVEFDGPNKFQWSDQLAGLPPLVFERQGQLELAQ